MQSDLGGLPAANNRLEPKMFTPEPMTREPSFTPETENLMPDAIGDLGSSRKSKSWPWIIITIIVIVGLAAVGYFVIYPILQSNSSAPAPAPTSQSTQPAPTPTALAPHASAFVLEPSSRNTIQPATLDSATIADLLKAQGAATANKAITEIIVKSASGQVPFATYLAAIEPNFLDASSANTWLADDFTAYIYKDAKGIWPGYIVKLKTDANQDSFAQWIAALEKNDLSGFFVTAPGKLSVFKNGTYKTISDRYATGAGGASFSYAVINGSLVINTSFDGLKEAVRLMGM